jgi:hypothetical protein
VFLGLVTPECQAIPTAAGQQMHDEPFDEPLLSDSVRDYVMAEVAEYLKKPYALIITNDTMYVITVEHIQIILLVTSDQPNQISWFKDLITESELPT